ncbi:MAG: PASTA domain-containing protein [Actinomycetota bacterium]
MDDLEAQLRRYADHVETQVEDVPAIGRALRPTSSRRWPVYAAAAAVIAVIGGLVGWSIGDDDDDADVATGDEDTVLDLDAVTIDSDAPITPRRDATIALSDEHVLVWGGFDVDGNLLFDGAIYDVAADSWATVTLPLQAKSTSVAVAIPDRVLAVVAQNSDVALVDFDSAASEPLPEAPFPVERLLWAGDRLVATSGPDLAVLDLDASSPRSWSPVLSVADALASVDIDEDVVDGAWASDDDQLLGVIVTESLLASFVFDPVALAMSLETSTPTPATDAVLDVSPGADRPFVDEVGDPRVVFVDDTALLTELWPGGSWFVPWQAPNDPRPLGDVRVTTVGDAVAILAEGRTFLWPGRSFQPPVPISLVDAAVVADETGTRFATFGDPSGDGFGTRLHVEALGASVPAELPVMVGSLIVEDAGEVEGRGWGVQEWGEMLEFSPDGVSACTISVYWGDSAAAFELTGVLRDVSDGTVHVECADEENVGEVWTRLTHVTDGPLVVDRNPPLDVLTVTVPSVAGLSATDAVNLLRSVGLLVDPTIVFEPDAAVPAGLVIATEPAAGAQIDPTSPIVLVVSGDAEVVAVPAVTALFADTAIQTLRNAGLDVATVFEQVEIGSPSVGRVIEQDPAPFEELLPGSIVTITVGEAAPEEAADEALSEPVAVPMRAGAWGTIPSDTTSVEASPAIVPFDGGVFIVRSTAGGDDVIVEIVDDDLTTRPAAASDQIWRTNPAVAWTGSELIVLGGSNGPGIDDLAIAYDPASDTWRTLSEPPGVDAWGDALTGPSVWTGEEIIVPAGGLAYRPASDSWRSIAPSPLAARNDSAVAWSGQELVVWGGCVGAQCDERSDAGLSDGAAYDPVTDRWRPIPAAPIPGGAHAVAVAADGVLVIYGGRADASATDQLVAIYDPAIDGWELLPPSPIGLRTHASGSADGSVVTFWGGQVDGRVARDGFSFDLSSRTWTAIPDAPTTSRLPEAQWVNGLLLVAGDAGRMQVFTPS